MKRTMTAIEAVEVIEKYAEERAVQDMRIIKNMRVKDVVRQGDIYIHCVDDSHKKGVKAKTMQLALGTSKGSRHIASGNCNVFEGVAVPQWCENSLLGPMIESDKRFVITHPEHAHISLPAGRYQVTHQMDARTLRRVQD